MGSTQAVVREWLDAGVPEVCVAVADEQTEGRGRRARTWQAPPGRALLVSSGFRPTDLAPRLAWRLPALAALAMLEAAQALLGPTADRLALKWPNDIVAVHGGHPLKVAGLLSESALEGGLTSHAIVGIGVNVDWPHDEFPAELAEGMWSLSEAAGGRRVDRDALLRGWLARLAQAYARLRSGRFDGRAWAAAQITTGAGVEVETDGRLLRGIGVGVDSDSGALLLRTGEAAPVISVSVGEVVRCRIATSVGPL